jgi:hypothetical protein
MTKANELMIDEEGFLAQDDWEFQLDCIPPSSRGALEEHLRNAPLDHPTAIFLKSFMTSAGTTDGLTFTPFDDK